MMALAMLPPPIKAIGWLELELLVLEGRKEASRPPSPLRTGLATFTASGSRTTTGLVASLGCIALVYFSRLKSPCWDRLGYLQTQGVYPPVTHRMQ